MTVCVRVPVCVLVYVYISPHLGNVSLCGFVVEFVCFHLPERWESHIFSGCVRFYHRGLSAFSSNRSVYMSSEDARVRAEGSASVQQRLAYSLLALRVCTRACVRRVHVDRHGFAEKKYLEHRQCDGLARSYFGAGFCAQSPRRRQRRRACLLNFSFAWYWRTNTHMDDVSLTGALRSRMRCFICTHVAHFTPFICTFVEKNTDTHMHATVDVRRICESVCERVYLSGSMFSVHTSCTHIRTHTHTHITLSMRY